MCDDHERGGEQEQLGRRAYVPPAEQGTDDRPAEYVCV
jgi:hypothetical protein